MEKYPNLENKHYLYCHYRADNGQPFYIGIGRNSLDNYYSRSKYKDNRTKHWKSIVAKYGYTIEIIMDNLSKEEAFEKEVEFIKLYGRKCDGGILCNLSTGGEHNASGTKQPKKLVEIRKESISNTIEDIYNLVYPEPNTGCFLWSGGIDKSRDKQMLCFRAKRYTASRFFFEIERGIKLLKSQILINTCKNKHCVNPDHFYVGSFKDVSIRTASSPIPIGTRKLTVPQVKEIRELLKTTTPRLEIANKFNVSIGCVEGIQVGKSRKHVRDE